MRAFLALLPDTDTRRALRDLQHRLRETLPRRTRWPHVDDLHLTLRFLGEVPADTLNRVESILGTHVGPRVHRPDAPGVAGLQAWPTRRRARVLVLALPADAALARLARQCELAAQAARLPADVRAFRAHITLAPPPGGDITLPQAPIPPGLGFSHLASMLSQTPDAGGRRYRVRRCWRLVDP